MNEEYQNIHDQFISNVSEHKMIVMIDNGVVRHIKFQREGQCQYWFEIMTWPGCLCIHGDMGTWVFSRIHDMFSFFRSRDDQLGISPDYWAQKIVAHERGSFLRFDQDAFRKWVHEIVNEHLAGCSDLGEQETKDLWDEIKQGVFEFADTHASIDILATKVSEFDFEGFRFPPDFYESIRSWQTYDRGYLWCLYAIVWSIKKYDEAKSSESKVAS